MPVPFIINTPEKKTDIVHRYVNLKMSAAEIARVYQVSDGTIIRELRRQGIVIALAHRRNNLNDEYFKTIDTEGKAYFLGFMMADGSVSKRGKESLYFSINLQEKDKYILEKFAKELEYEGELRKVRYSNIKSHHQDACLLAATSVPICKDLMRHGCVWHKTYYLEWLKPKTVPHHLMHHFVRGFFDGDGWNNVGPTGGYRQTRDNYIGFVGTRAFMTGLKDFLNKELDIGDRKICIKKNNKAVSFSIGGNLKTKKVYDYMYKDATMWLTRKKDKFLFSATPIKRGPKPRKNPANTVS